MLEPLHAVLAHRFQELPEGVVALADAARIGAAGREDREGVRERRGHAANAVERRRAPANRRLEPPVERTVVRERVPDVRQAEVHVTGLVGASAPHQLGGRFVRGSLLDEPQQIEERPLAEDRQKERRLREIAQLEE